MRGPSKRWGVERAYIRESENTQKRLVPMSISPGGRFVLEYVNQIRVTLELAFTLGSLWWTIRVIGSTATIKDQLIREEDEIYSHIQTAKKAIRSHKESSIKVRDRILPQQGTIMSQLQTQIEKMQEELEKGNLAGRLKLYREVKEFYTQDPDARYFRGSDYAPGDD